MKAKRKATGWVILALALASLPCFAQKHHQKPKQAQAAQPTTPSDDTGYTCAGKRKCGEMDNCEEATFYLKNCGIKKLDRDNDGVPCESLC